MKKRINVTKSILPDREEFYKLLEEVLDSRILTNNGPKCLEFERRLAYFLNLAADSVTLCANGTLALEIAIHAANAAGKRIITTPFTYVATVTAPFWLSCAVDFADIDPETLCISPASVAEKMRKDTAALIPVNIYGYPCDDAALRELAGKRPIIYDAAQAFGATLDGESLLDFGNFAICSLHATKVMHSVEGGFVVSHSQEDGEKLRLLRAFGHQGDDYLSEGINAKMSELHACMGLALLDHYRKNLEARKKIDLLYRTQLDTKHMRFPLTPAGFHSNYGYFPAIFPSEAITLKVVAALNAQNIFPRRYFYPSISEVAYLNPERQRCPIAEDISKRVLCLPLYSELSENEAEKIAEIVNRAVCGKIG